MDKVRLLPGTVTRTVCVDRSLSLANMIRAVHVRNERWALENVTEAQFPVNRSGLIQGRLVYEVELHLVPPPTLGITTAAWWDWMDEQDLVREEIPEILALGRDSLVLLNDYDIFAFGSSCVSLAGGLESPGLWQDLFRQLKRCRFDAGHQWRSPRHRALVSRRRRR